MPDSENGKGFEPMNPSAACVTDGYVQKILDLEGIGIAIHPRVICSKELMAKPMSVRLV